MMDTNRRKFIKTMFIGGGAILLGKLFGSRILDLFSPDQINVKSFENFRISENKKELIISDQNGQEIFIIDKENK